MMMISLNHPVTTGIMIGMKEVPPAAATVGEVLQTETVVQVEVMEEELHPAETVQEILAVLPVVEAAVHAEVSG